MVTFKEQLASINDASLYFGSIGYDVEVSIYGKSKSAVMTIFYYMEREKNKIYQSLCQFKDDGDVIEHFTYPYPPINGRTFYTMKLRKEEIDV